MNTQSTKYIPFDYFLSEDSTEEIIEKIDNTLLYFSSPIKKVLWLYNSLKTIKSIKKGYHYYYALDQKTEDYLIELIENTMNLSIRNLSSLSTTELILYSSFFSKETQLQKKIKNIISIKLKERHEDEFSIQNEISSIILPFYYEAPQFSIDLITDGVNLIGETYIGYFGPSYSDIINILELNTDEISIMNIDIDSKSDDTILKKTNVKKDKVKQSRARRIENQRNDVLSALHDFTELPFLQREHLSGNKKISRQDLKILFPSNLEKNQSDPTSIQKLDSFFDNKSNYLFFRLFLFDLNEKAKNIVNEKFIKTLETVIPCLISKKSTMKNAMYDYDNTLKVIKNCEETRTIVINHENFIKTSIEDTSLSPVVKVFLKNLKSDLNHIKSEH